MTVEESREVTGWRIAISGSRGLDGVKAGPLLVEFALRRIDWPVSRINHGDAKGIDAAVRYFCNEHDIPHMEYVADWDKYGKAAGPIRNKRMLQESDALIAIRLNGSPGTTDAISWANKFNVHQFTIDISDNGH